MAPTTRGLQKRRIRHREILKEKSRSGQFTLHTKGSVKTKENNKNEKTSGIKTSGRPAEDKTVKRTSGYEASGRPAEDETAERTSQEELVDNFERQDDVKPRPSRRLLRKSSSTERHDDEEPRPSGRPAARRGRDRQEDFSKKSSSTERHDDVEPRQRDVER